MRLCVLLHSAKLTPIGNNTLTIRNAHIRIFPFSPPLCPHPPACTASFCVFFFYRPTARPRRTSMPLNCLRNKPDRTMRSGSNARHSTWGLKSKVGLVTAKASALRINLNIQGCSVVAPSPHAPSHAPLLLPHLVSHKTPLPRGH